MNNIPQTLKPLIDTFDEFQIHGCCGLTVFIGKLDAGHTVTHRFLTLVDGTVEIFDKDLLSRKERHTWIFNLIEAGLTGKEICRLTGIPQATVSHFLKGRK
jgi:hypothetical protein